MHDASILQPEPATLVSFLILISVSLIRSLLSHARLYHDFVIFVAFAVFLTLLHVL